MKKHSTNVNKKLALAMIAYNSMINKYGDTMDFVRSSRGQTYRQYVAGLKRRRRRKK